MLIDAAGKTSGEENLQGLSLISDPQALQNLPQSNPLTLKMDAKFPHETLKHNYITQRKPPIQSLKQHLP